MRRAFTASIVAVAALFAAAGAEPGSSATNPATRVVCIESNGASRPAVCTAQASRIDNSEDICICPVGRRVDAPVCRPGERPPAETRAFERARALVIDDNSLVGDLYEGKPMCVAPRNP